MIPRVRTLGAAFAGGLMLTASASGALTPEELEEGWIQLFDGETLYGWAARGDATWEVREGEIVTPPGAGVGMLSTTTEFADFQLQLEFFVDAEANSGVFLRCPPKGDITAGNSVEVNISDDHPKWPTGSVNEVAQNKGEVSTVGRWNHYHLSVEGDHLVVRLNGEVTADGRDQRFKRGTVALQRYLDKGVIRFRNVKIRPLGMQSLFNGENLSGWKEIPDRASVYSVTPEGWLNVKNGNGDLQSEAQFGDFIFQLAVLSNGSHLNSGVFFRAIPGEFWSGYESQIRNQWEGEDRTKPVDFGTGGLYNRQPARRVVASDHEWFHKTIVAQGRHIAVWVNGYQVTDYTDDRPPHQNARQGYRAEPGVLSLQGHDPTTDLSFRNLRITELPTDR